MSERLEYIQQLEAQITTTKETLKKLKTQQEEAMLAVQHEEIEELEKYLDQAHVSLKDLSVAAEDAWQELKEAIEQLMGNISSGLKRLLGESDDSSEE